MDWKKMAALMAALALICGCISDGGTLPKNPANNQQNTNTQSTTPGADTSDAPPSTTPQEKLVTNLPEAGSSEAGYKCSYLTDGEKSEGYIQGVKFHFVSSTPEGTTHIMNDGTWLYTWVEGQEGKMYNVEAMKKLGDYAKVRGYVELTDLEKTAQDIRCRMYPLTEIEFARPPNMAFRDVGMIMQQIKMMESGQQPPKDDGRPPTPTTPPLPTIIMPPVPGGGQGPQGPQ